MPDFDVLKTLNTKPAGAAAPDLTVIIPTSNTGDYVESTLNCLTLQGELQIELIVVDYKSTDDTFEKLERFCERFPQFETTLIRQNKSGLGDARNEGIRRAKGEFIAVLDSDDFFSPYAYEEMVQFGRNTASDIIFCRGVVFDDTTNDRYPFYDDWVWDRIAGGRYSAVISARESPEVFRLEPNASIRIIRRDFVNRCNLYYPEGKRAEDMVPHYRALHEAGKIGFLSRRGIFYRVGRAGKLTSDPSKWINDLLEAISTALSEASHYQPSSRMGAAMIYLWMRAGFGYGSQLPYDQRPAYFASLSLIMSQIPQAWIDEALWDTFDPDKRRRLRMKVALLAMRVQDVGFLVFWSGSPFSRSLIIRKFLKSKALLRELLKKYGRRKALSRETLENLRVIAHG
jgi:glycosyltransferase involved in cell wall biosynthesis